MFRTFYIGLGAALLGLLPSAQAEEPMITLLNGVVIGGSVTGVSTGGLAIANNDKQRTYPWHALAPGTRFRYDQTYRMNLDGFLSGSPAATLTNGPDPLYDPLHPDAPVPETGGQPVAGTVGQALVIPRVKPAEPMVPSREKALSDLATGAALFWAVQSGPGKNDVVGFCFPEDRPEDVVSTLKAPPEGSPPVFVLPDFSQEGFALEQKLAWSRSGEGGRTITLRAEVAVTMGDKSAAFSLAGTPAGLMPADKALLPLPLVDAPVFDFVLRIRDRKPVIEGRLRMRQLTLIPGRNVDDHVQVKLINDQGKTILDERMKHQRDRAFTLLVPLDKVPAGSTVTLYARADLGELYGVIEFRERYTVPDVPPAAPETEKSPPKE